MRLRRRKDWVTSIDEGVLVDVLLERWMVVTMNGPASNECTWTVHCENADGGVAYRATTPREALDMAVADLAS